MLFEEAPAVSFLYSSSRRLHLFIVGGYVLTAKSRDGRFTRRLDREMWDRTCKLEYSVHDWAQTAHHELAVRPLHLRNSSLELLQSGAVHVIDGRKIDDDAAEAAVVRAGQRPT